MTLSIRHGEYLISDDPGRLDIAAVHNWLSESSYWAKGRSRETVERSIANSIPLGVYLGEALVGFARVVTDRATFSWLCDVFVMAEHRGRGLGRALVDGAVNHPDLAGIQRFVLATADAHELYRKSGFELLGHPDRWMLRRGPIT